MVVTCRAGAVTTDQMDEEYCMMGRLKEGCYDIIEGLSPAEPWVVVLEFGTPATGGWW